MENSNRFTNKNPEESSTAASSLDKYPPEDIVLNLQNLHLQNANNDVAAASSAGSNTSGRINIQQMIDSVLDEENSSLDEIGSIVPQAGLPSYQPEQCSETNFYGTWRSDFDSVHVMVNQKIANLALDAEGSLSLQTKLLQNDQRMKDTIFEGIFPYMFEVMSNEYGTHVFARLVQHCDQSQLQLIVTKITLQPQTCIESLFSRQGANSVSRLIKVLRKSPLVTDIVTVLASNFVAVMTNRISSLVVIRCFDCLNARQNQPLFEAVTRNCIDLAIDGKGCAALQESINYIRGQHRDQLLDLICTQAVFLSQDPIGNYVLQRVVELQNPHVTKKICSNLIGKYVDLSKQKCSSHVVETCLKDKFGMDCALLDFINYDKLWEVARNRYGNYVIQKALQLAQRANSPNYARLVTKLLHDKQKLNQGRGQNVYNMIIELDSGS